MGRVFKTLATMTFAVLMVQGCGYISTSSDVKVGVTIKPWVFEEIRPERAKSGDILELTGKNFREGASIKIRLLCADGLVLTTAHTIDSSTLAKVEVPSGCDLGIAKVEVYRGSALLITKEMDSVLNSIVSTNTVTYDVTDTTAPTITFSSISPTSPGVSQTPTVTLSLSEATQTNGLRLYSESGCTVPISAAVTGVSGANNIITTNTLTNHQITIYAMGTDAVGNASLCTSLTTYYYFSGGTFTSVTSPSSTQFTLNWNAGTADAGYSTTMQYLLCGAASPYSIDSVAECEAAVVRTYTTNSLTYTETGTPAHYYNIVTKNSDNIKSLYTPVAADHTTAELVLFDASVNEAFNSGSIANAASVTGYKDLSPLAANATSTTNPTYSSTCLSAKPGIVLNSNANLSFPHNASMNVTSLSFVLVFKPGSMSTLWQGIWFKDDPNSWSGGPGFGVTDSLSTNWGTWVNSYSSSPAVWGKISTSQPIILIGTFSGGNLVLTDHNGMSVTATGASITNNAYAFTIGGKLGGGACVSELKYFSKALSSGEQNHEFRIMKSKWNIAPRGNSTPRIFATSTTHTGNLGGLAGADAICQARASAGSLSNSAFYKAFISDSVTNAKDRFNLTSDLYNTRPSGSGGMQLIGLNMADIIDQSIYNYVGYDESGSTMSSVYNTWTATNSSGTKDGGHCSDWSSDGSTYAKVGSTSRTNGDWINDLTTGYFLAPTGNSYCSSQSRIYCMFDGVATPTITLSSPSSVTSSGMTLTWSATGTSSPYTVRRYDGVSNCSNTPADTMNQTSPYPATGLSASTVYSFKITDGTTTSGCVTATTSAASFALGSVTSTSSSVSLTWSGGTANYTAILFGGSGCSAGPTNHSGLSGTSDTFTSLLASTQYSVQVMDSTSAFTSCQNISTTAGGALTLGTLTPASTTVDASWSGGTPSYTIYLYSDSMCMTSVSSVSKDSATTHQFTGLTASTTYYAKVTDGAASMSPSFGCTSVTTSAGGGGGP